MEYELMQLCIMMIDCIDLGTQIPLVNAFPHLHICSPFFLAWPHLQIPHESIKDTPVQRFNDFQFVIIPKLSEIQLGKLNLFHV